jgi:hypothetical protein
LAIQHVKETVYGRLHDDFALLAADFHVGQYHVLGRGVVH